MNQKLKGVVYFLLFVTATVFAHWLLIHMYVKMCAPMTIFGPLYTFVSLGSPLCNFMNKMQHELASHYLSLWTGAAIAFISWLNIGRSSN